MLYGIFLITVFVALIAVKAVVERREYSNHQPDDEELLCALAMERGCSTYDIFEVAGRAWSCSSDRIDHDFDVYLDTLEIPAYVRHFLRKDPPSADAAHPRESRMPLMPI
jgi:hypothetical protein